MKRGILKNKRGMMDLPFGLIFSIILIVVFIVVAFIAIRYFLNLGKCSQVGLFYQDFENKINTAWKSTSTSDLFKVSLPSGIDKVCFANMSARITNTQDGSLIRSYSPDSNLFLIPMSATCEMPQKIIAHLNIAEITKTKNPYCISSKSDIKIKKGIYDKFVLVE